jgi:hypothetical protein
MLFRGLILRRVHSDPWFTVIKLGVRVAICMRPDRFSNYSNQRGEERASKIFQD